MDLPTSSVPALDGSSISASEPAGNLTFFFVSNCQLQFYAGHLVKALPGQVFCSGRAQVPFDSVPPVFLRGEELFMEARRRKAAGGENILILQETSQGQFTRRLTPHRTANFDTILRIPYFHFRSVWPNFRLKVAGRFTPRSVSRLFAAERHEFESTLARCGDSRFDAEDYWKMALEKLAFYHPGHADAGVLLGIYDAFFHRPLWAAMGAKALEVRHGILNSSGLPLICLHPIEPEWGDAVGTAWHRRPAYQAWILLKKAETLAGVRAVNDAKHEISREFGRVVGALFRNNLASRYLEFGAMAEAAENSAEAAAVLPGSLDVLSRALAANLRIGAWSAVEASLSPSLRYLHPGSAAESLVSSWLERYSQKSETREMLRRLSDKNPSSPALARLAQDATTGQPA